MRSGCPAMYGYKPELVARGSNLQSARTSGGNFWGTRHGPKGTARSRPPPLACLRREIWTRSCDGHGRNQGPTARYRFRMRQGALSPLERVPASEAASLPVSPRHGHQPTRRYNHKDFERSLADFEVCPRKRKKEGWYITLASTRAGSTGFTSAAGKPLRSECQ